MASYRLSPLADQDFSSLIEFGIDTFGTEHTISYALGMEQRFLAICANHLAYTAVDDIRENYRGSVYGVHFIYFFIALNNIKIIRILHRENTSAV